MRINKIISCLIFALVSTLSINAQAHEIQCLYKAYSGGVTGKPAMTKTWGTVNTWTFNEAELYDKMDVNISLLRMSPFPITGASASKIFYNYESVPQVEMRFTGVPNSSQYWRIDPMALTILQGENDPMNDSWKTCGPTGAERIIL